MTVPVWRFPTQRPAFGIEPFELGVGEVAMNPPDHVARARCRLDPPAAPFAVVAAVGHAAGHAPASALEPCAQARMMDLWTAAAGTGVGHAFQHIRFSL